MAALNKPQKNVNKASKPSIKSKITKIKPSINQLIADLDAGILNYLPKSFGRPDFSNNKKVASRLEATLATGDDTYLAKDLSLADLAAPHRAPYAALRDTVLFGNKSKVTSLVKNLCKASKSYEEGFKKINVSNKYKNKYAELADLYAETRENLEKAHSNYKQATLNSKTFAKAKLKLIVALNNLASNAPGLGPHKTANVPVSDNLHLQLDADNGRLTPRSFQAKKSFTEKDFAAALAANGKKKILGPDSFPRSYNTISGSYKVVNAGTRVFRGSLFVDENHNVYRPTNHQKATGIFNKDWEKVK